MDLRFEWDEAKNASNQKKHGVSFAEAQTAFQDERALLIADPDHSDQREDVIRIISARKANRAERTDYKTGD